MMESHCGEEPREGPPAKHQGGTPAFILLGPKEMSSDSKHLSLEVDFLQVSLEWL